MKVAVEGCAHGELDRIYEVVEHLKNEKKVTIDLLIICGDFQAVRNRSDLQCMAVPPKYQKLNTFYKYYSGEKVAPVLTIFIGGNHEASNYLSELSYGGWVCPNIYYLGNANVINIGGLRIAGISGIYKGQNYLKGHFERPPYDESTKRSVYHLRNIDVFRLKQVAHPIDICISHDWPRGVYNFGNKEDLLKWKPFFRDEMESNKLGSRPAEELLHKLQPKYWFAAHLHCKFAAVIPHEVNNVKTFTKFLALDKCLPKRKFLQVLDIGGKGNLTSSLTIQYDPEWLCILRSTNHLLNTTKQQIFMPGPGCSTRWDFRATEQEMQQVKELFNENFTIPENFQPTASPLTSSQTSISENELPEVFINSQTTTLCDILKITDPFAVLIRGSTDKSKNVQKFSFVEDLNVTSTSQQSINPDSASETSENLSDDESAEVCPKSTSDISTDLSDCSFYIDTKGSSSGFHSSERKKINLATRQALHVKHTDSVNVPGRSLQLTTDFPQFEKRENFSNNTSNMTSPEGISTKKFKRRNHSLYMNQDDE